MNEVNPTSKLVCPLWNGQDRRFRARHYAAWRLPCCQCGRDVAISRSKKKQADAQNLQFICEQCDLIEKQKLTIDDTDETDQHR